MIQPKKSASVIYFYDIISINLKAFVYNHLTAYKLLNQISLLLMPLHTQRWHKISMQWFTKPFFHHLVFIINLQTTREHK